MTRRSARRGPGMDDVGVRRPKAADGVLALVRWLGLALVVCVVAGRPLFPSEDAATGSGVDFILLQLGCGVVLAAELFLGAASVRPRGSAVCWLALIAALWLSAWNAGYWFAASMLAWEWTSIGVVWLLARHQSRLTGPAPMAALIVAAVIGQSLGACWQVAVTLPRLREQYERKDPMMLREMRAQGIEPGSETESGFRDRLYATEPYGSFGHPNSLAGFLVLGLPILVGALAEGWKRVRSVWPPLWHAAIILLVATAIVLTKSRSAWVAAPVGLAILAMLSPSGRNLLRRNWGKLIAAACSMAVVVVVLGLAGVLDLLVVTESFKSLRYRLEWWQASLSVIAESPWLGVGPGSFGSHYLLHKLPFSSEEIQDPHNFLLELWCCGGLLVLVAYLALLAYSLRDLARANRRESSATGDGDENRLVSLSFPGWWWTGAVVAPLLVAPVFGITSAAGGGAGSAIVVAVQLLQWPALLAFAAGLAAVALAARWRLLVDPATWRLSILAGVVALHVHWLASGGVNFPALLVSCWALLASAGAPWERSAAMSGATWRPAWPLRVVVAPILLGLVVTFVDSVYLPASRRDQILARIRRGERNGSVDVRAYAQAARTLPGDQSGWVRLAQAHAARMLDDEAGDPRAHYKAAVEAWRRAIALEPRRPLNYESLGKLHLQASRMALDPKADDYAAEAFENVVGRYPNSARRRWRLAAAYLRVGKSDEARNEFEAALRLDRTPHPDKKLTAEQRRLARQILRR